MTRGKHALLLGLVFLLIYLTPLATHPLLEPDEGRYAEIPREMIESGDYVTPRLNYVHYFEKPALLYWLNALSFKVFGENEFAARFPNALAALGGIAVTGLLASTLLGARCGLIAAVVLGTSLLYFAIGTINLTDMPLSFFLTLTMASFYAAVRSGRRGYWLLFYLGMGLAVLTKGLVGIVLPAGVVFWYVVLAKRDGKWNIIRQMFYLPGILAFFILTVPWFYLVCRENPDFFHFFFVQEHFLRYATRVHDRYEPFWFFAPILLAGTMPWTGCLVGLLGKRGVLRSPDSPQMRDANLFLLLWAGVVFLFFSLSSSKLIPYIVPCLPPLSILMAGNLERMLRGSKGTAWPLRCCIVLNLLFAAALFAYALLGPALGRAEGLPIAAAVSAGLLSGGVLAWRALAGGRDPKKAILVLCIGALLFALGLQTVYLPMGRLRSARDVALTAAANREPGRKIAVYGEILHSVPFYAKERVVLIDYLGELSFGAAKAGETEWFLSGGDFLAEWRSGVPYTLIVKKRRLERLFPGGDIDGAERIMDLGDYLVILNEAKKGEDHGL